MKRHQSTTAQRLLIGVISLMILVGPVTAKADQAKEFILSCSYGVLAGTLVGGATLAFSDKPGENLNKVARGASLGLYAGILLGLYVAYGSQGGNDDDAAAAAAAGVTANPPRVLVMPLISDRGFEGAEAQATVYKF